jgi:hypothetical protein
MRTARGNLIRMSLLLVMLTTSGCIYSREIQQTRREIERANPGLDLDRQMVANVGPVSLGLARWITSRVNDTDANRASKYLRDIRRVKVGVFNVRGSETQLDGIAELRRFRRLGWELAARVREDGEDAWVYYRERRGTITDMYAIVYSEDELVIARVSGRLTRLVNEALRDNADFSDVTGITKWSFWDE